MHSLLQHNLTAFTISSAKTFKRVSHDIWQALWQWCKRRHPKKNLRWIKRILD
ncbi:group II intron maturase-specific domain-containing protein [Candidatus Tisiphia endosymbiont of Sialis lutaria]|uniref:group II intron maturase-specific domain-containing protein n=1 Tax=Candidatus Tisiphia endosymbiont of Sialis lutaria TaxID=2029164 RepID=UPI0039775938